MKQSIFFDLDGTLTDPQLGITACMQFALKELDADVPSADDLTWCIGPPLLESFGILVGERRAEEALRLYRQRFSDTGWRENTVYPGVEETLDSLCGAGFRLYVATSKPHIYAGKIIGHFRLDPYFEAVYGAELDGTRSDKSELLRFALSQTAQAPAPAMVGDRKHDMIGALANDMTPIGVTYGFGSEDELLQAGAAQIVDRPAGLLPVFT